MKKSFIFTTSLAFLFLISCANNTNNSSNVDSISSSTLSNIESNSLLDSAVSSLDSSLKSENNSSENSSINHSIFVPEKHETKIYDSPIKGKEYLDSLSQDKQVFNNKGFYKDNNVDFSSFVNTSSYREVTTPKEFLEAIKDAKSTYNVKFDEVTSTLDYELVNEGKVKVIEIRNDLNLGYKVLQEQGCDLTGVNNFASKMESLRPYLNMSSVLEDNGMSQIKIENTTDLLIYSKNGAKITHAGFKLTSSKNIVIRNLQFDELWQWEDTPTTNSSKIGDYDAFGWAYFKISFSEDIWIDHCNFGKSYDGQIDYSNPVYNTKSTYIRAPYKGTGDNGLNVSFCNFNAGDDDKDGYIYKMMKDIEIAYLNGKSTNLFYNKLREKNMSFEEILYAYAIPQKKGFLLGDTGNNESEYIDNLSLKVSFSNNRFINLEDRIPKVRGGLIMFENNYVDSLQYLKYRDIARSKGGKFSDSTFKSALVSQGILCGNGGSFYSENSIYKGIETLIKNNDSNPSPKVDAGYKIVNCLYQKNENSNPKIGSSSDENSIFVSSTSTLNTSNFTFKNDSETKPFETYLFDIDKLDELLKYGDYASGINLNLVDQLLVF